MRKVSQQYYAGGVDQEFAKNWTKWGESKVDPVAWAWEGHEVASRITYGKLKPQIPVASPALGQVDRDGCNVGRATVEAMHIVIGEEYFNAAIPAVREQLAKAGYRIANLLNQGF